MKFKRVEISAFRIYDKPGDSTFDFTDKNGEIADFVSLYAPNGFGKTSFYDAVEWGMTNSIYRFLIRGAENKSLTEAQNREFQQPLIRNTKSNSELETRVKIITSENEYDRPWKRHGKNKYDLDFNKNPNILNKSFQRVILSQEWISSFLSEENGYERYDRFKGLPDLREIDEYYNNILALTLECQSRKGKHFEKIGELKTKLKSSENRDLLKTINQHIKIINQNYNYNFDRIEASCTDSQIYQFKNELSSIILSDAKEDHSNEQLHFISIAHNGDEKTIGLNQFYIDKKSVQSVNTQITAFETLINKFDLLEGKNEEAIKLQENLNNWRNELERANTIKFEFPQFIINQNKINFKLNEIEQIEIKINQQKLNLQSARRSEVVAKVELDTTIRELGDYENKLNKIPEIFDNLSYNQKRKEDLETNINIDKELLETTERKLNNFSQQIQEIEKLLEEIHVGQYPLSLPSHKQELIPVLEGLVSKKVELTQVQKEIRNIELTIQQQRELNTAIHEFIKQGHEIVNQNKRSNCPLCEQQFESYEKLAEQISNNRALNEQLQVFLQKRNDLNHKLININDALEKEELKLVDSFKSILSDLLIFKDKINYDLTLIVSRIKDNSVELNNALEGIKEANVQFDGLTVDEYKRKIKDLITELILTRDTLIQKSKTAESETKLINNSIDTQMKETVLLNSEIDVLKNEDKYFKIKEWFKKNLPDQRISEVDLVKFVDNHIEQVKRLSEEMTSLNESIEELEQDLMLFTRENGLSRLKELTSIKENLLKRIHSYEYFLKSNLMIIINDSPEEVVVTQLHERSEKLKQEIQNSRDLKLELNKLADYAENLKEFLEDEGIKKEIKDNEEELDFLNKKIDPKLKSERDKTVKILEKKIQAFFHTDLINKLYNKIDPHPEFKRVTFKASFEDNDPRLDIFVTDERQQNKLIPNLYFSTAQINILSLSIFLASALNSQEYNCIFIDDPIQSMDSINILSTIDLLRSISVQHRKQIILSTHDENFHKLLMKKIPSELFKSKFLELESFGKVKI